MTYAPLPTRAECVDVGNACMDGADAVMLSGETAKGKFPVKTVATMAQLCKVAEASEDSRAATLDIHGAIRNHHAFSPEEALAAAAVHASVDHDAKAILAITTQGTTARQISKFRPRCPIVCLTFSAKTARALQLCKGVHVSSSCRESGATRDLGAPLTAPMRPARLGRDPLKLPLPPLVGSVPSLMRPPRTFPPPSGPPRSRWLCRRPSTPSSCWPKESAPLRRWASLAPARSTSRCTACRGSRATAIQRLCCSRRFVPKTRRMPTARDSRAVRLGRLRPLRRAAALPLAPCCCRGRNA